MSIPRWSRHLGRYRSIGLAIELLRRYGVRWSAPRTVVFTEFTQPTELGARIAYHPARLAAVL